MPKPALTRVSELSADSQAIEGVVHNGCECARDCDYRVPCAGERLDVPFFTEGL